MVLIVTELNQFLIRLKEQINRRIVCSKEILSIQFRRKLCEEIYCFHGNSIILDDNSLSRD